MLMARDIAWQLDPVLFAEACGISPDPWQAELLRERPRRALLNCSRQSGKTTVTALLGLTTALYTPGALVVIASPSQNQSGEMLRTLKRLHGQLDGAPGFATESVLRVELENGSRIIALPGSERTVRGYAGVSLVILDEASRVEADLYQALKPMVATSNGSLVLLSTPAGKRGTWYDLWHNNDPTWRRISVPASMCPRISKEFLEEQKRELGAARYSEEFELAFIDSDTSAFNSAIIDAAFSDEGVLPLWF
jgi:hypothetical protein